jgi:hypothetical protein
VQVRVLEDAGSLQTRRIGGPLSATLPAGGTADVAVPFASQLPATLTHSGMVAALATGCPTESGDCVDGTSDPLFFHREGGGFVVYGERVLCETFRCGALAEDVKLEAGTWRVLGGGPLTGVPSHEEPEVEDDGYADGGDR